MPEYIYASPLIFYQMFKETSICVYGLLNFLYEIGFSFSLWVFVLFICIIFPEDNCILEPKLLNAGFITL